VAIVILVVLFNIFGVLAALFGLYVIFNTGRFDIDMLLASAPVFLTAFIALGIAQILEALIRSARASEAALIELRQIREANDRTSDAFDRLARARSTAQP
jgi:hypothetical protein